ncbi:MAG: hypothetical protein PHW82_02405 [Bacteroidales bacterium]|nr:hypothetical protein [Bacteroidales bacterium]
MKTKTIILVAMVLSVFLSACSTNTLKSGITGTLQYGEGNCVFDASFRTYAPYSGYIYFVNKVIADTSSLSLNELFATSDSTKCTVGEFTQKLEVGIYYLCIKEYPSLNKDNIFTINPNATTEQSFWIYKCI